MDDATRITLVSLLILAAAGCGSVTPVDVVYSDELQHVIDTHDVVLDCTVIRAISRSNLTLAENLFGAEPVRPSHGYKTNLTLRVKSVLQGKFEGSTFQLNDAQMPGDRPGGNPQMSSAQLFSNVPL